jgi:hypothetical protein
MGGELTLDEDLIIEGKCDSKMIHGARNLSIGSFAGVKADIAGTLALATERFGPIVTNSATQRTKGYTTNDVTLCVVIDTFIFWRARRD